MQVVSLSTLPVGGYAWRPRCGGHAFVVIAKATFELVPGSARLASTQDGLNETDNHWDDDESCSVYAPSDMAPFKERADITLVGNAYAPSPAGARTTMVRAAVAGMDKKVAVFCDRHLDEKGRVVEGEPFKRMALRYERAAGGRLSDNPVGVEPATKANRDQGVRRLPNLQTTAGGRRPAGFGPLAEGWPMRRRLLRSAAKRFEDVGWRKSPLPSALDTAYFNSAPRDQRVDRLRSDERILLENVHPRHPRLASRLPGLEPRAFVEIDGEVADVQLCADSLWIDMTRGVCTVTWRGSFEIASADQTGCVLVALQQPGEVLAYEDIEALQRPRSARPSSVQLNKRARESAIAHESQRPRMHTVDLAAGAEEYFQGDSIAPLPFIEPSPTETLVAHPPVEPLPFTPPAPRAHTLVSASAAPASAAATPSAPPPPMSLAPASAAAAPSAPPPPMSLAPSIAPPSIPAFSPWAGNLSARAHKPQLPPSDPASIAPPPLMLVPPPSPPPARRSSSETALRGPLPKSHRVEIIGSVASEVGRVCRAWRELDEDERAEERLDRQLREAFGASDSPEPAKARRHLVRIMTRSEVSDVQQMREAMMDAVDEDGIFEAPLTLTHGTLRLSFDAVETLRATIASVATYLKDNDGLREEVESAREILARQSVAPEAANDLTGRIRSAYESVEDIDDVEVDKRTERMLLEQRAYATKKLLGGELVRAVLAIDGDTMPCYLPAKLADATPLYTELCVRVIGELHPRQDQHETSARALRVIALGRVVNREEEC